jgi:hypothetical protein
LPLRSPRPEAIEGSGFLSFFLIEAFSAQLFLFQLSVPVVSPGFSRGVVPVRPSSFLKAMPPVP